MIPKTLIFLGIGAVLAGYSSTAQAQSNLPPGGNSSVTLSGESLRAVESRRTVSDYQTFFNGTLPTAQPNSVTNIGRLTTSGQRSIIGDQPVDVILGDTLNPERPVTSFPSSGEPGDTDRVKVQLQLGNQ